ncbi:MAG: LTA synthase family protein, partial [Flavobacteriales bacterium]|nr:LTA synthase family protein [Flavobacteriales bacterium]
KFTAKRTTADILQFIGTGNDFKLQVPKMLLDYWYLPLIALLMSILSQIFYSKWSKVKTSRPKQLLKWISIQFLLILPILSINAILARGGLQHKPLDIIHSSSNSPLLAPLILNTPFSIMKTYGDEQLKELSYFEEEQPFELIKTFRGDSLKRHNIFIIILESFSPQFTGLSKTEKSLTPFFDSLQTLGINHTNCYANGKKSIEGIPAIVAGLPSLMNDPFISSIYSNNRIQSLPSILNGLGYQSNFYHGGFNGTMGFEAFCKAIGYDKYYGKTEFNDDSHFDGQWGIYDEPFFQYTVSQTSDNQQPFLNTLFSLSNHHPFSIPSDYKNEFKEGKYPIEKTVRYTDFALEKFFKEAVNTEWYPNTIFIITADHSAPSSMLDIGGIKSTFHIPLLIFGEPLDTSYQNEEIVSQVDILPEVLRLIGYSGKIKSFGSKENENNPKFSIHYINNCYQIFYDEFVIRFDGSKVLGVYHVDSDPNMENPIQVDSNQFNGEKLEKVLNLSKSLIQQYNYCLIHNALIGLND